MKKLICAKDVEAFGKGHGKVFYIDKDTIITPSAKDAARACGIKFSTEAPSPVNEISTVGETTTCYEKPTCCEKSTINEISTTCEAPNVSKTQDPCVEETICAEPTQVGEVPKPSNDGVDTNMIYNVLKSLVDKGLLNGVIDSLQSSAPYTYEKGASGLKIVRGNSVQYKALDTGNPNDKVFYQEIVNSDDGCSMNAGFITIENCQFDWECSCDELYHVVEGVLTVTVGGNSYSASPGDSVFFPNGAKVAFGSPNKMKAFYATY
ncbi:MAG: cupin domain-containing protein [Aminipila sp.]